MTSTYVADEDAVAHLKALLTLAADGLAAEVPEGTEQEKAAVTLGRLRGRTPARLVLTCRGDERRYDWPAEWDRAVADHARATAAGAAVEARREEAGGSGPPTHERPPRAEVPILVQSPTGRGRDTATVTPASDADRVGAREFCSPDVDPFMRADTTGGSR